MIKVFSANSLKILNNSKEDFIKKYIKKSELIEENNEIKAGKIFHALMCYYLQGFDVSKMEEEIENELWENIKKSAIMDFIQSSDKKYIEQPFYVKLNEYYLAGRFDLVVQNGSQFTIIDWKTGSIPKDAKNDIQSIVYLHCASKLFNCENINMVYYSISKNIKEEIGFEKGYEDKILKIISSLN